MRQHPHDSYRTSGERAGDAGVCERVVMAGIRVFRAAPSQRSHAATGAQANVLRCLTAAAGGAVSDRYLEAACRGGPDTVRCAVSRLRAEGCRIERVAGLGYRLRAANEKARGVAAPLALKTTTTLPDLTRHPLSFLRVRCIHEQQIEGAETQ